VANLVYIIDTISIRNGEGVMSKRYKGFRNKKTAIMANVIQNRINVRIFALGYKHLGYKAMVKDFEIACLGNIKKMTFADINDPIWSNWSNNMEVCMLDEDLDTFELDDVLKILPRITTDDDIPF
jgi:hypothetical protein